MTGFLDDYGLVLLFAIIALQALGIPGLPGKTALVAAAILAARGHFVLWEVVAVAAAAGLVGGYAGYAVGRKAGRRLVEHRLVRARLARPLVVAETFFHAHGAKAVFFARFLPGLKVVVALAAGIAHMSWKSFAAWHALAAVGFAAGFGITAYYAGEGAIELAERFGAYALVPLVAVAAVASGLLALRRRRAHASAA